MLWAWASSRYMPKSFTSIAAILPAPLDGIPLAIEFAAASTASLGISQLATGLRDRFALLTSGRRTVARAAADTARATIDWSYGLLPGAEQRLFRCLSGVPRRASTLDSAVAGMADTGQDATEGRRTASPILSRSRWSRLIRPEAPLAGTCSKRSGLTRLSSLASTVRPIPFQGGMPRIFAISSHLRRLAADRRHQTRI